MTTSVAYNLVFVTNIVDQFDVKIDLIMPVD